MKKFAMPVAALFMGLFFGIPFNVSAAVTQRDVIRQPGESIRVPAASLLVEKAKLALLTETVVSPTSSPNPLTSTAIRRTATPPQSALPVATPVKPLPAKSPDGTYYIRERGVYSGHARCGNIGATAHCVHIWQSGGVTLQDFTIETAQGTGLQFDNNTTIQRGTIRAPIGGASGWHKVNVTFDSVTFDSVIGGLGLLGGGCENSNPRPNRNIKIRNSTFVNDGGTEMLYLKCAQDVIVENSRFLPASKWALSAPDGVNIVIRGNRFDLAAEPNNWLAIELPRVFGAQIVSNTVTGPSGDWMVYVNSGTKNLTITDNCVARGIGVLHTTHQAGGVAGLVNTRNGPC